MSPERSQRDALDVSLNDTAVRVLKPGETSGELWSNRLHADDQQRTMRRRHHCLRRRASDAMYRWFLGRAMPLRDSQDDIVRWFGTCTDIAVERLHLEQLLQNLLSNTVKCRGDEAPRIHVSAHARDERLFSATDNGIGIDARYSNQIFDIFKRLYRQQYLGTGIGLAISQKIVEHYGGHIRGRGEPGRGSTFFFALPASPQEAR
jgi:signal transduction histidine kinase